MGSQFISMDEASLYNVSGFQNTYYLGYRDLFWVLDRCGVQGGKALDFGCGTGRSTKFLKQKDLDVVGIDISESMLEIARLNDPRGHYIHFQGHQLPFEDQSFDLVLSCFVFLTIPTKQELKCIFQEINRVLKPGGSLVFVTGSKYLYVKKYLSYDVLPRKNLISGEEIEVTLKDLGVTFKNYFYSDEDYRGLIKMAGLELVYYSMPLGLEKESQGWLDESCFSPYLIYAAKKNGSNFFEG